MIKLSLVPVLFLSLLLAGCGGSSSSSDTPTTLHQVVGTVVLPEPTDQVYTVYVDDDADPTNGFVRKFEHFCDCGDFVEYYFDGVPPGTYYLYAVTKCVEGTQTYLGFYDTEAGFSLTPPEAPNATITSALNQTFDFSLGIVPAE